MANDMAGYTFERCDRYTADELVRRFYKNEADRVEAWLAEHPKDEYTEDDYIDVYHTLHDKPVGNARFRGLVTFGKTTKLYLGQPADNR